MKQSGLSLIELLVAVSIIGILLAIAAIDFRSWTVRYSVERQVKEMYTDLQMTRLQAKDRNRVNFVTLAAGQYTVKEDSNDNGTNDSTDAQTLRKNLKYRMTWSDVADTEMQFNKRGLYNDIAIRTICVRTNENPAIAGVAPAYDCLVISPMRISMGKMTNNGGDCNSVNCREK